MISSRNTGTLDCPSAVQYHANKCNIKRSKQPRVSSVLVSAVGWYAHVWYMSFVEFPSCYNILATRFLSVSFLACARLSVFLFFVSFFAGVNGCVAPLYQYLGYYSI